jgi:hypothetical protein
MTHVLTVEQIYSDELILLERSYKGSIYCVGSCLSELAQCVGLSPLGD